MGDRTTQERHFLDAGQVNIADEFTLTAEVATILLARQMRSNTSRAHTTPLPAPGVSCDPLRTDARTEADDMNSQIACVNREGLIEKLVA
jgi:hypothetical protein